MKKILKNLKPAHLVAATGVVLLVALSVYLFEVNRVYYVLYKTHGTINRLFSGMDAQEEKLKAEVEGTLTVAGEAGKFQGELFFQSPRKCMVNLDSERAGSFRIINGDQLWIYFEGAKTVLEGRPNLKQPGASAERLWSDIPIALAKNEASPPRVILATFGDLGGVLQKRFPQVRGVNVAIVRSSSSPEGKVFTVRGTFSPGSEPQWGTREVELDILAGRWLPLGMKASGMMRGIGYSLEVRLGDIDFDPVLPPGTFDFEPPPGVSVVSMSREALVQLFKYYAQAAKTK